MNTDFNQNIESELMSFIHTHYGLEVFTPGLERTRPIYETFLREVVVRKIKVTIIAGTNGKGQTAHTLTHLLGESGFQVALWTSPHILSLKERFNFFTKEFIGDISYSDLRLEIYQAHDDLKKDFSEIKISFYEFLFLVFLRLSFKNPNIEHLVLEVGLGGKLDAVNHFDADCASITSISRDHQTILGNRYDLILSEKIAVARSSKPLFTNFKLEYLNERTKEYTDSHSIAWYPLKSELQNYFDENILMAQALFQFLVPFKKINLIKEIPLFKGRREEMSYKGNQLVFIGAHNIEGVRRMLELFAPQKDNLMPEYLLISFSKRPIGEIEIMLKTLINNFGLKAKLNLAYFEHPKALEKIDALEVSKNHKINKGLLNFVTDWKEELEHSHNQKILVCGSYYFVGEVQRYILNKS